MRILAFDVGDVWTGIAVSDGLGILCKPLKSCKTEVLDQELVRLLAEYKIGQVVYGLPLNQYGKNGPQAEKTEKIINWLREIVSKSESNSIEFVPWDERRSSKVAASAMRGGKNKQDKTFEHAVAAAFILQNYLDFKQQNEIVPEQ